MIALSWLPIDSDWPIRLKTVEATKTPVWETLTALAAQNLDFIRTDRLDRLLQRTDLRAQAGGAAIRLAILGSSTLAHLAGAIRVAGLRHGLAIIIHQGEYGQYMQDLLGPDPALREFNPNVILLALDSAHLASGLRSDQPADQADAALDALFTRLHQCWKAAKSLGAQIIQQAALPSSLPLLGQNEHLLPGSPASFITRFNARLRSEAAQAGVMILAIDEESARHGLASFHDPVIWHRAKQEIAPKAAPYYGDLIARLIAASRGKSAKCLVLDLDNTLWGGVIGDDGLEGIVLGQGSAEGESFVAIQSYAKALARRGIALAVCSKNDDANARAPFERHPEMVLKLPDIACFAANWQDKATNIRHIAATLNLGLDALVFLDDNPAERALIRRELPMVRVIEMPEEPALVPEAIAASGWFEAVAVTEEDFARSAQYAANTAREALRADATDLDSYLASLNMRLFWRPFDRIGLARITQLINKTNQFNLTTRRYTEDETTALIGTDGVCGLQFRLLDTFGDNGMIGVVILRRTETPTTWTIDTWLMSCRVLGRRVEQAMLGIVAATARSLGAATLHGQFIASGRNDMVAEHYPKLGFSSIGTQDEPCYALDLTSFMPESAPMTIEEG